MAQHASDSVHAAGKLPPTLTPTGQFAGKPTLPISRSVTLIGSRKQARLQLISSTVSQNHALIVNADAGPFIRDLASRSHVLVNGQAVKESPLKEGDEIQIGRFTFRFNESPQTRGVVKKDVEPAAPARMVVDGADLPVPIDGKSMLIGRREICDIHLLEDTCSTTHAIVFEMDGRRYIRDLASRTGTFVNGKQIHQVELMPGDEIKVGETTMRYMADAAPGVTAEEEMTPTDLAAEPADLMPMENEAPVAPVSRAATPSRAARDAEDIAADALEMVQDQPAEIEPVEAAPAELEVEPIETEPEPQPQPMPIAEADAPPADVEAVEMEPLEIEPVAEEPEPAPAPQPAAPRRPAAPAAPTAKRPPMPDQLAAMNWAANQDQFLGGQPMALPPLPVHDGEPFIRDDSGDTAAEEDLLIPIGERSNPPDAEAESPAPPASEPAAEADLELEPLEVEAVEPEPVAEVEAAPAQAAGEEIEVEPEPIATEAHEPLTIEPVEEVAPEPLAEAPAAHEEAEEPLEAAPVEVVAVPEVQVEPEPIAIAPSQDQIEVEPEPVSLAPVEEVEAESEPVAEIAPPPPPKAPAAPPRPAAKVTPPIAPVPPLVPPAAPLAPAPKIAPPTVKLEPPTIRIAPTPPPAPPVPAPVRAPAKPVEPPPAVAPAAKKPEPIVSVPKKVEPPAAPAPPAAPKVVEPPRRAAEAPKAAPQRRAPVAPAALSADAFKAPPEESMPDFAAAVSEADVADELHFDVPEETEPLASAGGGAGSAPVELEDITAAPIPPMPDFSDIEADTIDFGADPALTEAPADEFAADESADEIAPLDLESAEAEAAQSLDFDLGIEAPPAIAEEPEVGLPVDEAPAEEGEAVAAPPRPFRSPDVASEVIEPTEATPESAQALDEVAEAAPAPAPSATAEDHAADATAEAPTPSEEVSLTDSTFGRAVEEFVGESTGPIVEDRAEAPAGPEAEQRGKAPAKSITPKRGFVSRFGPGASQLDLEPIGQAEPLQVTDEQEEQGEAATAAPETEAVEEPTSEAPATPEPADINGTLDVEAIEAEQEAERAAAAEREEAEAAPRAADELAEIEPIEAPPDALLTQQQDETIAEPEAESSEAVAEAKPPQKKLFDLEPIETPASRAGPEPLVEPEPLEAVHDDTIEVEPVEAEEHVELEPLDQPLAIEDEIKLTRTPQAAAPAPSPVDELREALELEPEAVEVEPAETREAPAARTQAAGETYEPLEVEAEAVEIEPEPFEIPPEPPAASHRGTEAELEPIDLDALALESLGDGSAAASAAPAPMTELPEIPEIEPIEVEAEPEPVAEAPQPAPARAPVTPPAPSAAPATATPPPARTAPAPAAAARTTPPPAGIRPPSPQPPPQPQAPIPSAPISTPMGDAFSWGANAEHFLGGQPLQLTPTIPPTRPQQQPQQQRPSPFAGATPATPRPAPRRPMPTPVPQQPQQPAASPRGGAKKAPTPVSTGFDGLAIGAEGAAAAASAGEVLTQKPISLTGGFDPGLVSDVFAGRRRTAGGGGNAQPPVVPASGGAAPAAGDGAGGTAAPTPQPRPRRATKAEPMGDAWTPNEKPIDAMAGNGEEVASAQQRGMEKAAAPEPEAEPIPPRKKRRWFGLRLILWILLLPAMAGAAWGIWNYLPLHSVVTGVMKFANVGALPQLQRKALQQQEEDLIKSPAVRVDARTKLVSVGGKGAKPISPGFIGDEVGYLRTVTEARFNPDTGTLTVPYVGAGSPEDRLRMLALLQAVYSANGKNIQDAQRLSQSIEDLTTGRADTERRMAELQKQIDDLTAKAQDMPTAADRTALEADAGRLESAYNAAVANVTKLTAELKSMRDGPAAATTQPAAALAPDDQLAKLQGELDQLNTKVGAIQEGRGEKARSARSQLDGALDSFNKQLVDAQSAVKDNPQLLAYLTDAHKLLDSTRQLTDQLIKRQQDQYGQLSELKARLNEKMLARRAEVWKKDPELVKLMDEKDIKTRQYNAAVGQNMSKEAAEIKTDLDYLNSSIRARQTVVADDSFYADAIDQLQKIIDTTQKGLEDDRKSTLQQLDEMQAMLAKSQPSLDSLTPEQKELAAKMDKSLADVSAARKQYTEAADAANKAADEEIRNLQQNASDLASKVAQRKQQVAKAGAEHLAAVAVAPITPSPADSAKAIEQKSAELAAAEKSRADAEAAFFAANKKLVDLRNRIDQARQAGELRDKLLATKTGLDQELVNRTNALDDKKRQADATPYPAAAPTASDVHLEDHGDQRPAYILGACGALFGFCVVIELLGRGGGAIVDERSSDSNEYAFESYEPDIPQHAPPPRATPVEV